VELVHDAVDPVGAQHHQVARVGPVEGQAGGLQLVQDDLQAAAAGPVAGRRPGPGGDQLGHLARPAAAQVAVLAHDQGVEVPGRDLAQLPDVLVAAVARAGDDPGAPPGHDVAALGLGGQAVDIVAGPEARAHIDELSMKYNGHEYRNTIESERVLVRIRPVRQRVRLP